MMAKVVDNCDVATMDESRLLSDRMQSFKIDTDNGDEDAVVVDHVYTQINRMNSEQLRIELQKLQIDSSGNKPALRRRLKAYHQRQRLLTHGGQQSQPVQHQRNNNATSRYYDHLVIIDFECTCEHRVYKYEHEIIEFPAILVDTKQKHIIDEFHAYVRPTIRPTLTDFCCQLTGISQTQIDNANTFVDVLDQFQHWLLAKGIRDRYAFVTDGPWDMAKFFQMQCTTSRLATIPHEFRHWINLRRTYENIYSLPNGIFHRINLSGMLTAFGMTFVGRKHSGIDDARNIARVVIHMLDDRRLLRVNERIVRRDIANVLITNKSPSCQQQQHLRSRDGKVVTDHKKKTPDEVKDLNDWRDTLAYRLVPISKQEFITGVYEDCETCTEEDQG